MRKSPERQPPVVALLPAGNIAEEWVEPLSLTVRDLAENLSHGWIYGFADALHRAGGSTVIIFVSSSVKSPTRIANARIPASIWLLPEPASASALRRALRPPRNLPSRLYNAPLHRLRPYLSTPLGDLADVLRREGCTAVVCQEFELPRFDVCALRVKRLKVPVFATVQGTTQTATRFESLVRPVAARRAAGFIVNSESAERRLRDRYSVPPDRIESIPNAIDTRQWVAADRVTAREQAGIDPGPLIVAWHGRVEIATKGLDLLLAAWQRVVSAFPVGAVQLQLLGDGPDCDELRALVSRFDLATVRWREEYVSDPEQVRAFLSTADAYVIPSRREGMPGAALEAMSCGLPVVATAPANISGFLPETDGHPAGIEVELDLDALAAALQRILDDGPFREFASVRAREHVVDNYDTGLVGERLARFFERRG